MASTCHVTLIGITMTSGICTPLNREGGDGGRAAGSLAAVAANELSHESITVEPIRRRFAP